MHDLQGSVQQYLQLSVAVYAKTAPSCQVLALLRRLLEETLFGDDSSRAEAHESVDATTTAAALARRAIDKQVLLELLLAFDTPQSTLQLLGCSGVPAEDAWRDARMLPTDSGTSSPENKHLDFSLVQALLVRIGCYASVTDSIVNAPNAGELICVAQTLMLPVRS